MIQRLQQRAQAARSNDEGFTLIELLIVIVVLGILAGIVVLGLGTFRADSQAAACRADLKQVQTATNAFMASPTLGPAAPANVGVLVTNSLLKTAPAAASGTYTIAANGNVTSTAC